MLDLTKDGLTSQQPINRKSWVRAAKAPTCKHAKIKAIKRSQIVSCDGGHAVLHLLLLCYFLLDFTTAAT